MGAATEAAIVIVSTIFGLGIRDLWRNYKAADRAYQLARADERFARRHRFDR